MCISKLMMRIGEMDMEPGLAISSASQCHVAVDRKSIRLWKKIFHRLGFSRSVFTYSSIPAAALQYDLQHRRISMAGIDAGILQQKNSSFRISSIPAIHGSGSLSPSDI